MTDFGEAVRIKREELGLTRSSLAGAAGVTPQFIAAIEDPKQKKRPSFEVLKRIVQVLVTPKTSRASNTTSVELLAAILDVDVPSSSLPTTIEDELAGQAAVSPGTNIWIVTDVIAEAASQHLAKATATQNLVRGVSYTFFVPFSCKETHWRRAIAWLARFSSPQTVAAQVRMFHLNDSAFSSRLRITNPSTTCCAGVYNLGGIDEKTLRFYPAPADLLAKTVEVLTELCLLDEQSREQGRVGAVSDPSLGAVERIFPTFN